MVLYKHADQKDRRQHGNTESESSDVHVKSSLEKTLHVPLHFPASPVQMGGKGKMKKGETQNEKEDTHIFRVACLDASLKFSPKGGRLHSLDVNFLVLSNNKQKAQTLSMGRPVWLPSSFFDGTSSKETPK